MLLVSYMYIQQYFNTSITVLTNQVWKLLIALFKVPNTGAFTVLLEYSNRIDHHYFYWCILRSVFKQWHYGGLTLLHLSIPSSHTAVWADGVQCSWTRRPRRDHIHWHQSHAHRGSEPNIECALQHSRRISKIGSGLRAIFKGPSLWPR